MKILIQHATIVTPHQELHFQKTNIQIENGSITALGADCETTTDRIIEGKNLHVSLGWFDPHVSFGEPGFEERETLTNGLAVAAASGFTTIGLNPDTNPPADNQAVINHLAQQSQHTLTQLLPIGCLTENNEGQHLANLYDMHTAGAVAFGDYKSSISNAQLLKIGLQYTQSFNGLLFSHPAAKDLENNGVIHEGITSTQLGLKGIPAIAESVQIMRDLEILRYTGGRLHFPFITTKESVAHIQKAKKEGLQVSCSVGLPHLLFDDRQLESFDSNFKFYPPLRTAADIQALREGLLNGTIDMVSAMHEPMNIEMKELEFDFAAPGSIGLEAAFGVLNTLFPLEKTIDFLTRGRKLFTKTLPKIEVGATANLTCFVPDPSGTFKKEALLSTSKNCAYLGIATQGEVCATLQHKKLWTKA